MERRYDIDWLRIAAVLLLIPYHTARVFNWQEDFYVKNDPTSRGAQGLIDFVGPWHMSLLFLLAGASSWLAFRHRRAGAYVGERFKRLLVPFIFAVPVLVLPQTWLAYRWHGKGDLCYWEYFPLFFTTAEGDLGGYQGGFSPGPLWFVLFLFAFSLVGLPLFLWLRNGGGRHVVSGFARLCRIPGLIVLLPALVLLLPWLQTDDDFSGQPPIGFFLLVVLGFILLSDERIGGVIDRQWSWLLSLGIAASVAYIFIEPRTGDWPDWIVLYLTVKLLYEIGVWSMILGLLGFGHRHLTASGAVLRYATEAAYPFYIIHQTVIVTIAYFVCRWEWPSAAKFSFIASASLLLTGAVYEIAVRRWKPVRFLFGMKPLKRAAPRVTRPLSTAPATRRRAR